MLDIECFTYLNKALESTISPIVVLASNRGIATIRGADDLKAAHGIPPDFLSRLLIIPTTPYEPEEIKRIVRIRATTEGVQITDAAIDKISEHGVRISLRYCLQLLTPSRYVCVSRVLLENGIDKGTQYPRSCKRPGSDRRPGRCRVRGPVSRRPAQRKSVEQRVRPGLHLVRYRISQGISFARRDERRHVTFLI